MVIQIKRAASCFPRPLRCYAEVNAALLRLTKPFTAAGARPAGSRPVRRERHSHRRLHQHSRQRPHPHSPVARPA